MNIDFQKVAEAIENSPQEIKDLMFSSELNDKIGSVAEQNKLTEEEYLKLADEIGYVILGLKPKSSFFQSLTETGFEKEIAVKISEEIQSNIFSKLEKIKKIEIQENKPEESEKKTEEPLVAPINTIGQSFEKIILNQAKAMQPARPADEPVGIMNSESGIMNRKEQVPDNLPAGQKNDVEIGTPRYTGQDPYREPTE